MKPIRDAARVTAWPVVLEPFWFGQRRHSMRPIVRQKMIILSDVGGTAAVTLNITPEDAAAAALVLPNSTVVAS